MEVKTTELSTIKDKDIINSNTLYVSKGKQKYTYEVNYNFNEKTPKVFAKDIDTLVLSKKIFKKAIRESAISINSLSAKNIYIEGEENLGGLTIHKKYIDGRYIYIKSDEKNGLFNRIDKVNIISDENIFTINLDEYFDYIKINQYYSIFDEYVIYMSNDKNSLEYKININKGTIIFKKNTHYLTKDDIDNDNTLDMRNIIEYDDITIKNKYGNSEIIDALGNLDTIVFNKSVLKSMDKFKIILNTYNNAVTPYIFPKNIRIIDENDMQLIPTDVTYSFNNAKTFLHEDKRYLYLENGGNDVLIYIDDNDNLKIIEKNKLLNNENVESVDFIFEITKVLDNNILTNLIIIKYVDNTYTIKSCSKDININEDFNKILLMNKEYLKIDDETIENIKNNNWIKILKNKGVSNNSIERYNEIYLKYLEPLNYLYSLNLNSKTINYLWDRNYMKALLDNIIKNKEENIIKDEIETFKLLAKRYNN